MSLSETLQRLRKERGLSQEDVAQKLFVSRQSVSKWENGAAEPGVDSLKALAKLYGVTLDELVGNNPPPEVPAGAEIPRPTPTAGSVSDDPRSGYNVYAILLGANLLIASVMWGWLQNLTIPVYLVAMVAGVWITAPAMWAVINVCVAICALSAVATALPGFVGWEDVALLVVSLGISAANFIVLSRPSVKARFHLGRS